MSPYITTRGWSLSRWIEERRALSGRLPRRYATLDALGRMMAENCNLTKDQALHLTVHGIKQNEDASFSWKFDNYVRSFAPIDASEANLSALWIGIDHPTLLIHGADSWVPDPLKDGSLQHFYDGRLKIVEGAGHWVHHDRPKIFLTMVEEFLAG